MAEAAASGFSQSVEKIADADAATFVNEYLSRKHRDALGDGCTLAALSGDAARQPESIKQAFAAGIESQLATLAHEDGALDEIAKREPRGSTHLRMSWARSCCREPVRTTPRWRMRFWRSAAPKFSVTMIEKRIRWGQAAESDIKFGPGLRPGSG
jgi:hypothetical protein